MGRSRLEVCSTEVTAEETEGEVRRFLYEVVDNVYTIIYTKS